MASVFSSSLRLCLLAVLTAGCAPGLSERAAIAACTADPTCLGQALRQGDLSRFSALLEAGLSGEAPDDDGDALVHLAAIHPDPRFLAVLLRRGVDPDTPNAVTGRTPLMSALVFERDAQVDLLLAAGVDLNRTDRTGNTALHVAAQINDPGKVMRLLEAGAPVDVRNAQRQTFQRYLYMTRPGLLHRDAAEDLARVTDWLAARGQLDAPAAGR